MGRASQLKKLNEKRLGKTYLHPYLKTPIRIARKRETNTSSNSNTVVFLNGKQ
jgi:hypothetical protein